MQQAVHNACDGEDTADDGAQCRDEVIERLPLLCHHDLRQAATSLKLSGDESVPVLGLIKCYGSARYAQ